MRICVFIEPHRGSTYHDQLRAARHAEACGYEGFFRADHYMPMHEATGLPGPTDSWLTLAGLARETTSIRLGTLLSSATFRLPSVLAISVAQVDQMSGGRVELGLGAGWFAPEHAAYGIPFPSAGERMTRLREQLEVVTGLWATPVGERFSYKGEHYQLADAPALPKPVQRPGPPVIVGGRGPRRTPELAAKYADEFNVPFTPLGQTRDQYARVAEACERHGRARSGRPPLVLSVGMVVACGRTEAEVKRRVAALHEVSALPDEATLAGSPSQVVDQIGQYAELGATRAYVCLRDLSDLDHLDLLAAEVVGQLP